jgi:hypothetical protein
MPCGIATDPSRGLSLSSYGGGSAWDFILYGHPFGNIGYEIFRIPCFYSVELERRWVCMV